MITLETGYEIYNDDGSIDTSKSRKNMHSFLKKRNFAKYSAFLIFIQMQKYLWNVMWLEKNDLRQELFLDIYDNARFKDDLWDNDTPLHIGVDQKKKIMNLWSTGQDIDNSLPQQLEKSIALTSEVLGYQEVVSNGLASIEESLMRDAQRVIYYESALEQWAEPREALQSCSEGELDYNFARCDIVWCILPTSVLYWLLNTEEVVEVLTPLWVATRRWYTLYDILEEPKKGLLNIPWEAGLSIDDKKQLIESVTLADLPTSVVQWAQKEAKKAKEGLKDHYKKMSEHHFEFESNPWKRLSKRHNKKNDFLMKKIVFPLWYEKRLQKTIRRFV